MYEIPYNIKLIHGEVIQVDWEEAYNAYRAVCIRKKLPFLTPRAYLQKDVLLIDGIIFEQLKPRNFV